MYAYWQSKIKLAYLGDALRVGIWQPRWKTLGHLSQQSSSPPFWHTAHQSSLGSSSGSGLFSVCCSSVGGDSCCWVWDCTPVLSGRLALVEVWTWHTTHKRYGRVIEHAWFIRPNYSLHNRKQIQHRYLQTELHHHPQAHPWLQWQALERTFSFS